MTRSSRALETAAQPNAERSAITLPSDALRAFNKIRAEISRKENDADRIAHWRAAGRDIQHRYVRTKEIGRQFASDQLYAIVQSQGWTSSLGEDFVQKALAEMFAPALNGAGAKAADEAAPRLLRTLKEFLAEFVSPDYLIDGVLQKHFVYSLTGSTNAARPR